MDAGGPPTAADVLYRWIWVGAVAFLAFVLGAFLMLAELPPYGWFRDVQLAGRALARQRSEFSDPFKTDLWQPARTPRRGVTVNQPGALQGYTLYTSGDAPEARLIDMSGRVVHRWAMPYSQVWDSQSAIRHPVPDTQTYFRDACVFPNGDLIAVYDGVGDTPHGYGMIKLDRNSNLLWKYLQHAHHDVDVAPDGRVFTLTHEVSQQVIEGREYLKPPRIDDYLVELSPQGQELRRFPLLQALHRSPYTRLLEILPWYLMESGDFLHSNAVQYIDAQTAAQFDFAEPGQILLSMREPGALAVFDLDRGEFTWALRGPWIGQHDPDLLDNGHILLFDNNGHLGRGARSRVLEFDPRDMRIAWQYAGTDAAPLDSVIRAQQQRLRNGNTLITESGGGRLIEVTAGGEVVWEYLNPARAGPDQDLIAIVSAGQRLETPFFDDDFLGEMESPVR